MFDVIVIGGGLAGCCSAINLANAGKNVLLLERGHYPRHKICGEFLSVEVMSVLDKLGVSQAVHSAGAVPINSVSITTASGHSWNRRLPAAAYGFSRFQLDDILFHQAGASGVKTVSGATVTAVDGNIADGFAAVVGNDRFLSKVVIGSFGKKSVLVDKVGSARAEPNDLVGFKQHFTGASPISCVEVYAFDQGYCGINPVENGLVNVCWLARRSLLTQSGGKHEQMVNHVISKNGPLRKRLAELTAVDGTLCAIGGVSLRRRNSVNPNICLAGDALQMIAPLCGDGMGMALRSGEVAAEMASGYLDGKLRKNEVLKTYRTQWASEFSVRLALGKMLQQIAFSAKGTELMVAGLNLAPVAGDILIGLTRGSNYSANSSSDPSMVSPGPNASAIPKPLR